MWEALAFGSCFRTLLVFLKIPACLYNSTMHRHVFYFFSTTFVPFLNPSIQRCKLCSNQHEMIIKYLQFIIINTNIASGEGISFIDAGYSERYIIIKKIQWWINTKAKLKEMPSSSSCITYRILDSLVAPRDSSYLQACLKCFYS